MGDDYTFATIATGISVNLETSPLMIHNNNVDRVVSDCLFWLEPSGVVRSVEWSTSVAPRPATASSPCELEKRLTGQFARKTVEDFKAKQSRKQEISIWQRWLNARVTKYSRQGRFVSVTLCLSLQIVGSRGKNADHKGLSAKSHNCVPDHQDSPTLQLQGKAVQLAAKLSCRPFYNNGPRSHCDSTSHL